MKPITAFALAVALSGCASHQYLADQYAGTPRTEIQAHGDRFAVWESAGARRVLVMVQRAGDTGFTFNPSFSSYAPAQFESVAQAYFTRAGRRCEVYEGRAVLEQRWEFKYRCEGNV